MPPSSGKVIVVDDDKFVYLAVSTIFEKIGYEVLEANTGREALRLVEEQVPRCVFLDIQMPGMDGYEVCSRIRENPATSDVPVIYVSAKDTSEGFDREIESGGNFFVSKPFQPNDLAVDLYFLNELNFQPQRQDLPRLRVARSLKGEAGGTGRTDGTSGTSGTDGTDGIAVDEALAPSVNELKSRAKQAYQDEEVDMDTVRELRLLMLGTSYRLAALIRRLEEKGILREDEIDNALHSIMAQERPLAKDKRRPSSTGPQPAPSSPSSPSSQPPQPPDPDKTA